MNEHIQVPKELLESLLNSVNGDFYMGKEWEESTVAELRKHIAALASQAQQEAIGEVQHYAAPANLPAYVNVKWYGKPPKNGTKVYALPPAPEGE